MSAFALRTRRMMIRDMGRAGTAIMVFGLAACASDPDSDPAATRNPSPTTQPGTGSTPTSSAPDETTTSTSPTLSNEPAWHRVNMGFVSAYILYRGGEAALVDTGVTNSEAAIEAALAEVGLGWDSVGHVIVTHQHQDHQGSLPAVVTATNAPWYAGAADMGAIPVPDGIAVGDGDRVFDLDIIESPGHTPGHLSILDAAAGVLVTGDAMNGADGGVVGANPNFTSNPALANASIRKLAGFDYEVALFGHGEPILSGASEAVATLADNL